MNTIESKIEVPKIEVPKKVPKIDRRSFLMFLMKTIAADRTFKKLQTQLIGRQYALKYPILRLNTSE